MHQFATMKSTTRDLFREQKQCFDFTRDGFLNKTLIAEIEEDCRRHFDDKKRNTEDESDLDEEAIARKNSLEISAEQSNSRENPGASTFFTTETVT